MVAEIHIFLTADGRIPTNCRIASPAQAYMMLEACKEQVLRQSLAVNPVQPKSNLVVASGPVPPGIRLEP